MKIKRVEIIGQRRRSSKRGELVRSLAQSCFRGMHKRAAALTIEPIARKERKSKLHGRSDDVFRCTFISGSSRPQCEKNGESRACRVAQSEEKSLIETREAGKMSILLLTALPFNMENLPFTRFYLNIFIHFYAYIFIS